MEGEGKKEMYELLPPGTYPRTIFVQPGEDLQEVRKRIENAGICYPFIVKPDVGMKGLLFRKVDNEEKLSIYHSLIPFEYIVQDLVTFPLEVSVFYYRYPGKDKGVITGFIQKDLMEVVGNGRSTLWQLILDHPKARLRLEEMQIRHGEKADYIPGSGEVYQLAHAANLNRGATFTNLENHIDEDLLDVIDRISKPAEFYYGRFDIKCSSIEDLKKGVNFSILEFNGSGAEPNHVYQSGLTLWQANKIFLKHWKALYEISALNNRRGIAYWPFNKGFQFLKEAKKHLRKLEEYEKKIGI